MTFDYVISNLKNGEAAKTPAMIGYVKREDFELTNEDRAAGIVERYNIEFVGARDGDRHAFLFVRPGPDLAPEVTGSIEMGPALLLNLVSSDWTIHPIEVLEKVRANRETAEW